MKRGIAGVAALGAVLLVAGAPAGGESERASLKKWIDGPVRYLVTHDEVKMFRALSTDAERAAFIEVFWRRRDTIPETPENEYRRLFQARVKEANDNFTETATPGWKSDRGRIHILCGPPSRIESDSNVNLTGISPTAGHGLVRWVYEGRPCGRSDMGPVFIVPFVMTVDGEYRLSEDPNLSTLVFNASDYNDLGPLSVQRWMNAVGPGDRSELGAMMDLGKFQEVAHPEEILLDRVETVEAYGSHPLAVEVDRFRYPRGGTLAVITVAVPGEASTEPAIMARLTPRDATRPNRFVTEESFKLEGTGNERVAQARLVLDPGVFDLTVLSAEGASTTSGLFKGTVEVRAPEDRMRLSDVVLSRTLEPLKFSSLVSYDEPYFVGVFRVVPRVLREMRPGQTVNLFHEVYGGVPPFRVSYQLEGKENDGRFTPLGKPQTTEQAGASQAWSVTVGQNWPAGEYRVLIRVQDSKDGVAEAAAPFTVATP